MADKKIPLPHAGETAEQYHQRLIRIGLVPESASTGNSDTSDDDNIRLQALQEQFMKAVPADTTPIGNNALREKLVALDLVWETDAFSEIRKHCIDLGLLRVGRGKGGSVARTSPVSQPSSAAANSQTPAPAKNDSGASTDVFVIWEKSIAAFKAGDFPSAIQIWESLANQGMAKAQYNLSLLYFNGKVVARDSALALKWCQQAAQLGHAKAQHLLGQMYATGNGVDQDDSVALTWYQKSAEAGNVDAQFALGSMLRKREAPDMKQAFKWLQKAAEQGKAVAQLELARMYEGGWGGKKMAGEAIQWLRKAAEQGNAEAEGQLGEAYMNGRSVGQDCVEGVKWLRKAVEHGNIESAHSLGWAYEPGNEDSTLEKSYDEAVKWYRLAANQGELNSFEFLEGIYESDDYLPKNKTKAIKWLLQAAEQGDVVTQYMIAARYEDGEGLNQDYVQAARWYEAAAKQYCSRAQLKMGNFCENGIGVAQNYADAAYWYNRAIDQKPSNLITNSDIQGDVRSEAARCLIDLNNKLGQSTPPELAQYASELNTYVLEETDGDNAENDEPEEQVATLPFVVSPSKPMDMPWKLPTDWKDALSWSNIDRPNNDHILKLRTGAERGDTACQNLLGILYLSGIGVPYNMIAGQALLELATAAGNTDAAENLLMSLGGGIKALGIGKLVKQMIKPGKFLAALDKFVADREARRKPRKTKGG